MQTGAVTFTRLERVTYGMSVGEALADAVKRAGVSRVFILASRALVVLNQEIQSAIESLDGKVCGIYSGMPPHTPRDAVLEAAESARKGRAEMIVTIGGGSITDAAKAVCLAIEHDLKEVPDFDPFIVRTAADGSTVAPEYRAPSLPLICCPTTLSAGEYNPLAGVSDPRKGIKQAIRSPGMAPSEVILDPALTLPTPEWLWLSTGVRAIDHCVEAICSPTANAYCDAQSLYGLRLLTTGLKGTKTDPTDLQARSDSQLGAWLSMSSVQAGVSKGASHAIGHILGGSFGVSHGHTSCVMLPHVMRWNLSKDTEKRQRLVSEAMGDAQRPASDVIQDFIRDLGMPSTLKEVGVTEADFQRCAELSMHDRWIHTNPRSIKGPEDVLEILKLAA
ncbi:MAG: iron-containing alcohol dehydrogenase [Rhodospirillales bacterium]